MRKFDGWRTMWGRPLLGRTASRRIQRASILILIFCFFSISPSKATPPEEGSVEYPVKLAFLFNFTKFVEWPSTSFHDSGAPLTICIVGSDPFSPALEGELRTRTAEGHRIEVKGLKSSETLTTCHIVFVPETEKGQAARIVKGLKGSSTLTVGETAGFATLGGIINFTVDGNKLHFEVNLLAAERAGLKISSKLLSVGKIVRDEVHSNGE